MLKAAVLVDRTGPSRGCIPRRRLHPIAIRFPLVPPPWRHGIPDRRPRDPTWGHRAAGAIGNGTSAERRRHQQNWRRQCEHQRYQRKRQRCLPITASTRRAQDFNIGVLSATSARRAGVLCICKQRRMPPPSLCTACLFPFLSIVSDRGFLVMKSLWPKVGSRRAVPTDSQSILPYRFPTSVIRKNRLEAVYARLIYSLHAHRRRIAVSAPRALQWPTVGKGGGVGQLEFVK
jgi:hypothetical protein